MMIKLLKNLFVVLLVWLIGGWPAIAFALPQDGQVVGGSGTITEPTDPNGPDMQIDQTSQQMIINWQSFNIGSSEWVNFTQPNSNAIALNRVIGADPSLLLGKLTANGNVFISNGSGVFFGPSSTVDTHGFVATTMGIADQDFIDGNYNFTQDPSNLSSVINEGNISATSYVGLLAPAVENRGTIVTASLGSIDLASGKAATMDFTGDGLIQFEVTEAVSGTVLDKDGNELEDRVSNTGLLHADGGQIRMSAKDAGDVIRHVVNMEGMIKANTVVEKGGKVFLMGGDSGVVNVSGTIDASGDDDGEKGGTVHVTGEKVGLFDEAKVDVSGDAGGGTALIGGDYQGKNEEVQNAKRTFIGEDAVIDASAGTTGDGGKVIVWADEITRFYGSVKATGGSSSGNGGFVETSGKNFLDARGFVNTLAPNGELGTWLLDPTNVIIASTGSATLVDVATFGAGSGTETLDVSLINGSSSNVVIQANNDITVNAVINITNSGTTLSLHAGDDININANITTNNGAITISSNHAGASETDTGTQGVITMADGTAVDAGNQTITLFAQGDITLSRLATSNATTSAISVTSSAGGIIDGGDASGTDLDAGNGRIIIDAQTGVGISGSNAIETNGASLDITNSTSGGINIAETDVVQIFRLNTNSSNGAITLTVGGNIEINNNFVVDAGSGDVSLNATSGHIIDLLNSSTAKITTTGSVTLIASTSIGESGDQIEIASSSNLTLDANQSIHVSTDVALTDLTITLNPGTTADTYSITDDGTTTLALSDLGNELQIGGLTGTNLNFSLTTDTGFVTTSSLINVGTGSFSITTNESTTANGSITISNTIAAGSLVLDVNNSVNSDINIDAAITITGGDATITATDFVDFASTGSLTASGSGNIVIQSNTDGLDGNNVDGIEMDAATVIDAGSGTITLTSTGTFASSNTVGQLTTTNGTASALTVNALGIVIFNGAVNITGDVSVNSEDGIAINANFTTGNMALEGDSNNSSDGTDSIVVNGATLSSTGTMTLDATTSGITISGTATFSATSGITINDGFTISTGTVNFNSDTSINAILTLTGGILNLNGADVDLSHTTLIWNGGGDIQGIAGSTFTTTAGGGMSSSGSGLTLTNVIWNNQGSIAWSGAGGNDFAFTNSTFNNSGTFQMQTSCGGGGCAISGTGTFNNSGTIITSTSSNTQNMSLPFNNTGQVNVTTGDLNINTGDTTTGDIGDYDVSSGRTLNFTAGIRDFLTTAEFTGSGTVEFGGGTQTLNTSSFASTLTTLVSGGQADFNVDTTVATLNVTGGVLNLNGATVDLTVNSGFSWTGGTIQGTLGSTFNTTSGVTAGTMTASSSVTLGTTTWNNAGIITFDSNGQDFVFSGNAEFNNSGTFNLSATASGADISGTGTFNNSGILATGSSQTVNINITKFNNAGQVNIVSGDMNILNVGDDTGDYDVSSGRALSFSGTGTRTFATTSEFTGAGSFGFISDATFTNVTMNNTGTLVFSGGMFNTAGTNLSITTSDITLLSTLDVGAGDLTIIAASGGIINLGATAGGLQIDNTELNNITAANVNIGDATTGAITVHGLTGNINITNLNITSRTDIGFSTGGSNITKNLVVVAGGNITNGAALSVGGTSSFTVTGEKTITLDNISNDFTGAVSLFSGTGLVQITDTTGLILGASTLGGALTVNADDGIQISGNVTTAGVVTLDTDVDNNGTGDLVIDSSATLNSMNQSISITANDINFVSGFINAGTGDVTLLVSDNGMIGVGGTALDMTISDTDLDNITAGNLNIGNGSNGAVTIDGVSVGTVSGTLKVSSGGTVTFSNTVSTFSGSLTVSAGGTISQGVSITVGGSSSFTNTTGDITMNNTDNNLGTGLTIDTSQSFDVKTKSTLTDLAVSINPAGCGTCTYDLTDSGNLTFTVTDSGSDVTLTSVSVSTGNLNFILTATTGNINLADNAVSTGAGNVALISLAGNIAEILNNATPKITTTGTVTLTGATGIGNVSAIDVSGSSHMILDSGQNIGVVGDTNLSDLFITVDPSGACGGDCFYSITGAPGLTFSMTETGTDVTVTNVTDTALNFGLTSTVGNIIIDDIDVGTGTVAIVSAGSITEMTSDTTANITTSGAISLKAGTSIGTSGANNEFDFKTSRNLTLDVKNDFYVKQESGSDLTDLTLVVDPATGMTYSLSASNMTLSMAASSFDIDTFSLLSTTTDLNFSLTVTSGLFTTSGVSDVGTGSFSIIGNDATDSSITINHALDAGVLNLDANGSNSDISINAVVDLVSGSSATLRADDSIAFASTGSITALGAGDVIIQSNANVADGGGDAINMADMSFVNAGSGTISLTSTGANAGNIAISRLITTSSSSSAVTINVATNVIENGDNGGADVDAVNGGLVVNATDGVGSANPLEIDVATVNISNADSNSVGLNLSSDVSITGITSANQILFTGTGAITQTGAVIARGTNGLSISTTGAVTLNNVLNDVNTLSILTTSGNVSYVDADGFEVNQLNSVTGVSTGGGSVHLTATTGDITATRDITATTGITIVNSGAGASFDVTSGDTLSTSSGDINITADRMALDGSVSAIGQRVTLKSTTAGEAVVLGSFGDISLELSDAELDNITANYLEIGSTTQGAFTVSNDVSPANIMVAHLISNFTVTGTAGGIVVSQLAIEAGGIVNFTDTTTDVDLLAIDATGFDVTFYDVDDLDINTVDTVVGVKANTFTTNGPGPLTTTSPIVLDSTVDEEAAAAQEEQVDEGSQSTFVQQFTSPIADGGC